MSQETYTTKIDKAINDWGNHNSGLLNPAQSQQVTQFIEGKTKSIPADNPIFKIPAEQLLELYSKNIIEAPANITEPYSRITYVQYVFDALLSQYRLHGKKTDKAAQRFKKVFEAPLNQALSNSLKNRPFKENNTLTWKGVANGDVAIKQKDETLISITEIDVGWKPGDYPHIERGTSGICEALIKGSSPEEIAKLAEAYFFVAKERETGFENFLYFARIVFGDPKLPCLSNPAIEYNLVAGLRLAISNMEEADREVLLKRLGDTHSFVNRQTRIDEDILNNKLMLTLLNTKHESNKKPDQVACHITGYRPKPSAEKQPFLNKFILYLQIAMLPMSINEILYMTGVSSFSFMSFVMSALEGLFTPIFTTALTSLALGPIPVGVMICLAISLIVYKACRSGYNYLKEKHDRSANGEPLTISPHFDELKPSIRPDTQPTGSIVANVKNGLSSLFSTKKNNDHEMEDLTEPKNPTP